MKPSTKIRKLYKDIKKLKDKLDTATNRHNRHKIRQEIIELENEIREIKNDSTD